MFANNSSIFSVVNDTQKYAMNKDLETISKWANQRKMTLRGKWRNTEFFLVSIFLYSDGIRRFTECSQSVYRKIRTTKEFVFRHFFTQREF